MLFLLGGVAPCLRLCSPTAVYAPLLIFPCSPPLNKGGSGRNLHYVHNQVVPHLVYHNPPLGNRPQGVGSLLCWRYGISQSRLSTRLLTLSVSLTPLVSGIKSLFRVGLAVIRLNSSQYALICLSPQLAFNCIPQLTWFYYSSLPTWEMPD